VAVGVVADGRGNVVSVLLGVDRATRLAVMESATASWRTPIGCNGVGPGTTVIDGSSTGASFVAGSKLSALRTLVGWRGSKMIVGWAMMHPNG
jgi:hypothetical protein